MIIDRCQSCGLPVLELEGQFASLDSYYTSDGDPPPETAGEWHSKCLSESPVGNAWCDARVRAFRDVRGYQTVAELADWIVLEFPRTRDVVGFGRDGRLLGLTMAGTLKPRLVDGGAVYPVEVAEFNLELEHTPENEQIIGAMQAGLTAHKEYPLPGLVDALQITDRIMHPVAIERGVFRLERSLQRDWDRHWFAARATYGILIPSELAPFVTPR